MEQSELLLYVTDLLEKLGIEYMLVGSMASIVYGESRFTLDIDIVVDLDLANVITLCTAFPESDFYVSQQAAEEAVRHRRQFNVIHPNRVAVCDGRYARNFATSTPISSAIDQVDVFFFVC